MIINWWSTMSENKHRKIEYYLYDKRAHLPQLFTYETEQQAVAMIKGFCMQNDYNPVIINDEEDFKNKINKYKIDLLIVNLEVQGSLSIINYVKSEEKFENVPILTYSGKKSDSEDAINLGADEFISKFVLQYKIANIVKKLLRKKKYSSK